MDIFHRVNDDIYVFKTGLHKAKLALQVNGITIGVHTRYSLNYEYGLPLGPTLSNPNGPSIEFTDLEIGIMMPFKPDWSLEENSLI